MKLTKSQIKFLSHVNKHGQEPEVPAGSTPLIKVNQEKTKAKLIELELLTPAKLGRVIISNKGVGVLKEVTSK